MTRPHLTAEQSLARALAVAGTHAAVFDRRDGGWCFTGPLRVRRRRTVWAYLRETTRMSYPDIAALTGSPISTVIQGVQAFGELWDGIAAATG